MYRAACLLIGGLFYIGGLHAQVQELYPALHGGRFSSREVRESPDPLIAYRWDPTVLSDSLQAGTLQVYTLEPRAEVAMPASAFVRERECGRGGTDRGGMPMGEKGGKGGKGGKGEKGARLMDRGGKAVGAESRRSMPGSGRAVGAAGGGKRGVNDGPGEVITVRGVGSLRFDFGVESAGWLEFDSEDLGGEGGLDSVEMSISEYNEPAVVNTGAEHPVKTLAPVRHGHTYRLELNHELYEGVRFGWIHVRRFSRVWHIRHPRLVCQVRPVNYTGSFSCNDTALTRIWYTGAYVVKLNLLQHYFGAILMERSDRQSWTGDAYPSQAAALAAFGNYDAIRANMRLTAEQGNGIAAYPLYWVLSLADYYYHSGDSAFFREYIANADAKLVSAYESYEHLPALGFMGWDERLGAGFEDPQTGESRSAYRMLCIRAWRRFAEALRVMKDPAMEVLAAKYLGYADAKERALREAGVAAGFGVHAIAEAVNAGLLGDAVVKARADDLLGDRLNRLSYSPFNQYFILQAMASAGRIRDALVTVGDCWGGQLRYGGTSFFEDYRPSWNDMLGPNDPVPNNQCGYTSLAHPWSAGVTKWLSENILGIRPVLPGFRRFCILPRLEGGLTRVEGSMPTPAGAIAAAFDKRAGTAAFTIPAGLMAERVAIPGMDRGAGETGAVQVWVNGRLFYVTGAGLGSGTAESGLEGKESRGGRVGKRGSRVGAGAEAGGRAGAGQEGTAVGSLGGGRTGGSAGTAGTGGAGESGESGESIGGGRAIGGIEEDSGYIYLMNVRPGSYAIKLREPGKSKGGSAKPGKPGGAGGPGGAGKPGRPGKPRGSGRAGRPGDSKGLDGSGGLGVLPYPLPALVQDSLTSGDWAGKYGRDGYRLFGEEISGQGGLNAEVLGRAGHLPGYVDSIRVNRPGFVVWDSSSADSRVLKAPGNSWGRAAALITNDPNPTWQTFVVDIALKQVHPYRVSLYFLDWDHADRRSAVEIFDLETLNILAPVALVRRYERGVYVSFSFDRPVRIRIDHVRGRNAALSGIFFDPAGK